MDVNLNHLTAEIRDVPNRVVSWMASRRGVQPMRVFEDLYGGSAPVRDRKSKLVAQKPDVPPASLLAQQAPVMSFDAMELCPSLYFAGDLSSSASKEAERAAGHGSRPTAPALITAVKPVPAVKAAAPAPKLAAAIPLTSRPVPPAPKASTKPASAVKPVVAVPTEKAKAAPALALMSGALSSASEVSTEESELEVAPIIPIDDGFGVIAAHGVVKKSPASTAPHFEPLAVGDAGQTGLAYELNRRHDGQSPPAGLQANAKSPLTSGPQDNPDLSRAVRLTRDALYAWVDVLSRPAAVTVSQSKQPF
jgi:hypothetical protein